ncbi:MAG: glycosyltransferase family 4 protein [Chloroflexi bacterium]|nr:glycosyltransferase family 4 protein [Chloroflexota bacterium]
MISVDARQLAYHSWSGVEQYTYQILLHLAHLAPDLRLDLHADQPLDTTRTATLTSRPNVRVHVRRGSARFYGLLPASILLSRNQVHYAMGGRLLYVPLPIPTAVTIYDLLPLTQPALWPGHDAAAVARKLLTSIERADLVVTISEFSRQEIEASAPRCQGRVVVAPPAAVVPSEVRRPATCPDGAYLLMVNPGRPNKNALRVLAAFGRYRAAGGDPDLSLVLAGALGDRERPLQEAITEHGLERRVIATGYLTDEELGYLYRHARAMLFPSTYEGFGMPALEALSYGLPLLVSDIPPLREITSDAALVVSPTDVEAMTDGIARLHEDECLRANLQERSRRRAAAYSWDASARSTLAALRSLL